MSSLAELQTRFQRHIVHDDDAITGDIFGPDNQYRQERLGVYYNAYRLRLAAALAVDYPVLKAYLDERGFEKLAIAYIEAHPSMHRNLRWFGRDLPGFLRSDPEYSSQPFLSELAEFEWAQGLAFDAPDAVQVSFDALAAVPPDDWPGLRFVPHPSLHLVRSQWNVVAIWHAHRDDRKLPAATNLAPPGTIAVWRKDYKTYFRTIETDESRLWRILADGTGFGVACTRLAAAMDNDEAGAARRASDLLRTWVTEGWIHAANTESES